MSDIGTAYVQIEPSAQGISGKIEKEFGGVGESSGKSFNSGFGKTIGGIGKVTAGAVAAAGAGLAAVGTGFINASKDVAAYGDSIDKMSQKVGMSTDAYQKWDYVLKISGTEMSSMTTGLKTLTNKLDDAKGGSEQSIEMFKQLGLSMDDLAGMSREEVFGAVINGFQGLEDSTERAALANDLFGKSGQELAPLFNTSREETAALIEEVSKYGGVMSEDAVKASAAFQDQLTAMQTAFTGLSRNLTSEFLPDLTSVMAGLTEIFAGNGEGGLKMISDGISSLVDGITDALPQVVDTGVKILEALATAILDNLPKLMEAGMDILKEIVKYIIASLPMILETGTKILVELALGIAKALPELIPAAIDAVLQFVDTLLDNIDMVIDAALQLIIGLAEGLIQAIPKILEKAPTIITKLVQALIKLAPELLKVSLELISKLAQGIVNNIPKLLQSGRQLMSDLLRALVDAIRNIGEIGRNIVDGIKNGIANAWNNLTSWFKGLFGDLIQVAKDILGIASPSKVFRKIGEQTTEGFDEGMKDFGVEAMADVQNAMDELSGVSATVSPTQVLSNSTARTNASVPVRATSDTSSVEALLQKYLPFLENGTDVSVFLQGDAQGLFRQVRKEVNQFTKSTGNSPFIAPA